VGILSILPFSDQEYIATQITFKQFYSVVNSLDNNSKYMIMQLSCHSEVILGCIMSILIPLRYYMSCMVVSQAMLTFGVVTVYILHDIKF